MIETKQNNFLLLDACRRKPTPRTPVWFMRQAGRTLPQYRKLREKYDLLTLCKTPELAAEVTLQPVEALEVDAAILFADLLLPLEPMGIPFHFAQGEGPVIEKPIRTRLDIQLLRPVHPEESLSYVLSAIRLIQQSLKGKVPLVGFAGAPFTLASYMIEGGHSQNFLLTKKLMHQEPELWADLMWKTARIISGYLRAQAEAGVNAVQLFDSWVGALSPQDYRAFVLPYSKFIIDEVSETGVPLIHFGTGMSGLLKTFAEAGGDVIGVDWRIQLDDAWKIIGDEKGIQGNLDPALLFAPGEHLKSQVKSILRKAEGRPGHIFNLGHGLFPETPVDQLKTVVETVKNYQREN